LIGRVVFDINEVWGMLLSLENAVLYDDDWMSHLLAVRYTHALDVGDVVWIACEGTWSSLSHR
jgi:hypothetical protein